MKKMLLSSSVVISLAAAMVLLLGIVMYVYLKTFGAEDYEKFVARFPASTIDQLPSVSEFRPCSVQTNTACITTNAGLDIELEGSFKRPVILKLDSKHVRCAFPKNMTLDEMLKQEAELTKICRSVK